MHETFEIRKNVLQIRDSAHANITLITGSESALVFDAGHGPSDNRRFIESLTDRPYTVILSHGHPDHTQGAWQFDGAWMSRDDLPAYDDANAPGQRRKNAVRLAAQGDLAEDRIDEFASRPKASLRFLRGDEAFDLGDMHPYLVRLPGHTKGELGLVIPEERLLLSGDAFSRDMWMFAFNHSTLDVLEKTLEYAMGLPVDEYLISHSESTQPIESLGDILECLRKKEVDPDSKKEFFGEYTYSLASTGGKYFDSVSIRIPEDEALRLIKKN
ncbi:MAG: MBL fold metallo-hydrolase [Oscillospiraceae bacterium]